MQTAFLYSFLVIAETGSFSKAAQLLHTSQPALTQQMHALEREIGFKLFSRAKRNTVQLTPAGSRLVPELKGILNKLDEAIAHARGDEETIRISCLIYDSNILPLGLFERIQEEMPGVHLELKVEEKDVLLPLLNGTAEMAISGDCFDSHMAELEFAQLESTRYLCVMSPSHPLANHAKITLEEMVRYPVSFSVPHFSNSYNLHVEQIRRSYPQLQELPNYTHIFLPSVMNAENIYLSVCSAKEFFHGMACVPLAEDWEMPAGLLYRKNCSPSVRRIAKLACEISSNALRT